MRLKLQLLAPLPIAKYLLSVPDTVNSIASLKAFLALELAPLVELGVRGTGITLEIDGFELVENSSIGVLQPEDVVSIKLKAESSSSGKKRKRVSFSTTDVENQPDLKPLKKSKKSKVVPRDEVELKKVEAVKKGREKEAKDEKKQRKREAKRVPAAVPPVVPPKPRSEKALPPPPPPSTAPQPETESESDSESHSSYISSSSSSTSSSSSSSSASSRSDSPPFVIKASQATGLPFPHFNNSGNSASPGVPPGQGKASTHDRNARRRKHKAALKAAQEKALPKPTHSPAPPVLEHMLPTQPAIADPSVAFKVTAKEVKNKGKGFLKKMAGVTPQRIVFKETGTQQSDSSSSESSSSESSSSDDSTPEPPAPVKEPSPIPEYPQIPNDQPPVPKASSRQPVLPPSERSDLPSNLFVTSAEFKPVYNPRGKNMDDDSEEEPEEEEERIEPAEAETEVVEESEEARLWAQAEAKYDGAPVLDTSSFQLIRTDSVVAWKELELDLTTFSPALKLHVGTVTPRSEGGFVLKQLDPPVVEEDFYEAEEEYDDNGELVEVSEEKEEEQVEPLPLVELTASSLGEREWRLIKL